MSTPLTTVRPGESGVVTEIQLLPAYALRLAELGIRPGVALTVVQRTSGGGIVVKTEGTRIALDRKTAAAVNMRAES